MAILTNQTLTPFDIVTDKDYWKQISLPLVRETFSLNTINQNTIKNSKNTFVSLKIMLLFNQQCEKIWKKSVYSKNGYNQNQLTMLLKTFTNNLLTIHIISKSLPQLFHCWWLQLITAILWYIKYYYALRQVCDSNPVHKECMCVINNVW